MAVAVAAAVTLAVPAMAQTPAAPAAPAQTAAEPTVNMGYAGILTGGAGAQKFGGMFGGEAGVRVRHNLDIFLEGGWVQNAVTKSTQEATASLVTYLQSTNAGKTATATVKAPTTFAVIGGRWVFESDKAYRPYILVGVGGARRNLKPSFSLSGTDITGQLGSTYGVTLGSDLNGVSSHVAVTAGGGVVIPRGAWYVDAGYRLTSVATKGNSTNINRLNIGFGARF